MKIVDHQLEDWKDRLLIVPGVVSNGRVLKESVKESYEQEEVRTHGPRSRIRRARYIEAAAQ